MTTSIYPDLIITQAVRVVNNAYGTHPKHTRGRNGKCREDCIPCGIDGLRLALVVAGVEGVIGSDQLSGRQR